MIFHSGTETFNVTVEERKPFIYGLIYYSRTNIGICVFCSIVQYRTRVIIAELFYFRTDLSGNLGKCPNEFVSSRPQSIYIVSSGQLSSKYRFRASTHAVRFWVSFRRQQVCPLRFSIVVYKKCIRRYVFWSQKKKNSSSRFSSPKIHRR